MFRFITQNWATDKVQTKNVPWFLNDILKIIQNGENTNCCICLYSPLIQLLEDGSSYHQFHKLEQLTHMTSSSGAWLYKSQRDL